MPERRARVRGDGGNADDGGAVAKVTGTGTSARPCHAVVRCYGRMSSAGAEKTRGNSAAELRERPAPTNVTKAGRCGLTRARKEKGWSAGTEKAGTSADGLLMRAAAPCLTCPEGGRAGGNRAELGSGSDAEQESFVYGGKRLRRHGRRGPAEATLRLARTVADRRGCSKGQRELCGQQRERRS